MQRHSYALYLSVKGTHAMSECGHCVSPSASVHVRLAVILKAAAARAGIVRLAQLLRNLLRAKQHLPGWNACIGDHSQMQASAESTESEVAPAQSNIPRPGWPVVESL